MKILTFYYHFFFISIENAPKLDQNKCLLEADGLEIFEIEANTEKHWSQEVRSVTIKYIMYLYV